MMLNPTGTSRIAWRGMVAVVVTLCLLPLVLAGCSGSVDPEPLPTPNDSNGTDTTNAIPLDGRGGGVVAYCYQPLSGPAVHEIYALNADGTGNVRISNAQVGLNHHDWSPNAQRLAAVGYPNQTTWSIYVFDSDGGNLTRLTSTNDVWDSDPSWSPDGAMIAFTRIYPAQGDRNEVWLMDAGGTNKRWNGVEGDGARWSPDGSHFVYSANPSGTA